MELGDKSTCICCMGSGEEPARILCFKIRIPILITCRSCGGKGFHLLTQKDIDFNEALDGAVRVWEHKKLKAKAAKFN